MNASTVAVLGASGVYGRHLVPRLARGGSSRPRARAHAGFRRCCLSRWRRHPRCRHLRSRLVARRTGGLRCRDQPRHVAAVARKAGRRLRTRTTACGAKACRSSSRPAPHRACAAFSSKASPWFTAAAAMLGRRDDAIRCAAGWHRRRSHVGRARDGSNRRSQPARLADPARRIVLRTRHRLRRRLVRARPRRQA